MFTELICNLAYLLLDLPKIFFHKVQNTVKKVSHEQFHKNANLNQYILDVNKKRLLE